MLEELAEAQPLLAELTEAQLQSLRITICVFSTVSTVLGLFVVLTFACFPEKRRTSTGILVFFLAIVGTGLTMSFMIPGYAGDYLSDEGDVALCYFQAGCFLFFGMALQFAWFFITINLFLRVHLDRPEVDVRLPFAVSLIMATLATIIPIALDTIRNDGVWCFIDSTDAAMLFACFYGEMVILTLIGTPLWVIIIWKMTSSVLATWNSGKVTTINNEKRALLPQADPTAVPSIGQSEKLGLLIRQAVFVTGFVVIFYIMVANRIVISLKGVSFAGWLIHSLALANVGTEIFFVFGMTQKNFMHWRHKLMGRR